MGNANPTASVNLNLPAATESASASQAQSQPQSVPEVSFNGYSVGRILSEWEHRLEGHVNGYIQHGAQIRHWDQKLLEDSAAIIGLQKEVATLVDSQCSFNIDLEKIRAQQQNLTAIIEALEKDLGTASASNVNDLGMGGAEMNESML